MNRMWKQVLAILLLAAMVLSLAACNDTDNNGTSTGSIIGTWEDIQRGDIYVFEKNGSCTYYQSGSSKTFKCTYTAADGRISIIDESGKGTIHRYELTGDTLKLTEPVNEGSGEKDWAFVLKKK